MLRILSVLMVLLAVAGCKGAVQYDIEKLKQKGLPQSEFGIELFHGHIDLASSEVGEDDFPDARGFLNLAEANLGGVEILPDSLEKRDLTSENRAEASEVRRQLVQIYGRDAQKLHPKLAAQAQIMYDCWVQELEENNQPDDIAACRGRLEGLLAKLQAELTIPEEAIEVFKKGDVLVYFSYDSADIAANTDKDIVAAGRDAVAHSVKLIIVTANADRRGTVEYNYKLSLKRGNAVRDILVASGVDSNLISVIARGEEGLPVATADEVLEPGNRRAKIEFRF